MCICVLVSLFFSVLLNKQKKNKRDVLSVENSVVSKNWQIKVNLRTVRVQVILNWIVWYLFRLNLLNFIIGLDVKISKVLEGVRCSKDKNKFSANSGWINAKRNHCRWLSSDRKEKSMVKLRMICHHFKLLFRVIHGNIRSGSKRKLVFCVVEVVPITKPFWTNFCYSGLVSVILLFSLSKWLTNQH